MKLKQRPQDFRVTELLDFEESRDGEFFVHRVRKERMDTLEALDRIARAAGVKRPSLAYAGLKDRQAVTEQYVSILGKRIDHEEEGLSCKFVGRSNEAISSKMSRGNRFRIIVRDLSRFDATRLRRNKASVTQHGLPNYFDDQRFGCLEHGQGLVALSLAKGRPDEALRRLIARPPQGRAAESGDAKLKRILNLNWGDWVTCAEIARGPMYEGIFNQLDKDGNFAAALDVVPMRLKLIHLYSLQSFIWNRAVSRYLQRIVGEHHQVWIDSIAGELCTWRYFDDPRLERLHNLQLPLIDAGTTYAEAAFGEAVHSVLEDLGIAQADLARLDEYAGFALKEELRPLMLRPRDLEIGDPKPDTRNPGQLSVEMRFELPRGAYATLCVRRLFSEPKRSTKREDRDDRDDRRGGGGRNQDRGYGRDRGERGYGRDREERGYGRDREERGYGRDREERGYGRDRGPDRGRGERRFDRGPERRREEREDRGRDRRSDRGPGRGWDREESEAPKKPLPDAIRRKTPRPPVSEPPVSDAPSSRAPEPRAPEPREPEPREPQAPEAQEPRTQPGESRPESKPESRPARKAGGKRRKSVLLRMRQKRKS
jgi:tRNA pseudouridine13 synthase